MKVLFILACMVASVSFADEVQAVAQETPAVVKKLLPQEEVENEVAQSEEVTFEEEEA